MITSFDVVYSKGGYFLQAAMGTMDFIIDTIAAVHSLAPLLNLLKMNGKLVTVGLPDKPLELPIFPLVLGKNNADFEPLRKRVIYSLTSFFF